MHNIFNQNLLTHFCMMDCGITKWIWNLSFSSSSMCHYPVASAAAPSKRSHVTGNVGIAPTAWQQCTLPDIMASIPINTFEPLLLPLTMPPQTYLQSRAMCSHKEHSTHSLIERRAAASHLTNSSLVPLHLIERPPGNGCALGLNYLICEQFRWMECGWRKSTGPWNDLWPSCIAIPWSTQQPVRLQQRAVGFTLIAIFHQLLTRSALQRQIPSYSALNPLTFDINVGKEAAKPLAKWMVAVSKP